MKNIIALTSSDKKSIVKIDNGELISYFKNNEELIHQKGSPGWERSDLEMFPIIGPTSANNNQVLTPKEDCIQDQHGFLRELTFHLVGKTQNSAILEKINTANTKIKNHRFPNDSKEEFVFWPYDFSFKKSFELKDDSLKINFEFHSEKGMPFMFGFHPTFKLSGKGNERIKIKDQIITIDDVMEKGGAAYPFFDVDQVSLIKKEGQNILLKTEGFNNIMFWTEVKNMVCLEPITQYPDIVSQSYSEKNMKISKGKEAFTVEIIPFKN